MFQKVKISNIHMGRFEPGDDLYQSVQRYCFDNKIQYAWIQALGSVANLSFFYFDQEKKKYIQHKIDENLEILNCTGNVSLSGDKAFVHMHIVCADRDGKTIGGHLTVGTVVNSCEIIITALEGKQSFARFFDEKTGLHVWNK